MADEETVANQQSSWWTADAGEEAPLPPPTFDDSVDWANAIRWPGTDQPPLAAVGADASPVDAVAPVDGPLPGDGPLPPVDDFPLPDGPPPQDAAPLEGAAAAEGFPADGGHDPFASDLMLGPMLAIPTDEPDAADFPLELLPASIWAAEQPGPSDGAPADDGLAGSVPTDTGPAATGLISTTLTNYAEPERPAAPYRRGRLGQAKPAAIAAAALAALVLISLLFSVRNRSDVSPTASQGPGNGDIAAQAVPRTVVISPPTTLFGNPSPSIAAIDLLPPGAEPAAGSGPGDGGGASPAAGAPAAPRTGGSATTTPTRASSPPAPAGQSGGGGGGATQPAGGSPSPAPAPAPPDPGPSPTPPPSDTSPDTVQPPVTNPRPRPTTPPTQPDVSIPTITIPPIDSGGTPATTRPKSTVPPLPPGFGNF